MTSFNRGFIKEIGERKNIKIAILQNYALVFFFVEERFTHL